MSHAKLAFIALATALACAACGEPQGVDDTSAGNGIEQSGGPAYIGTFTRHTSTIGLTQLVLKTDSRFHSARVGVCVAQPCVPVQEDGIYRMSMVDRRNYMTLYNRAGDVTDQYEYDMQDDTLRLLRVARNGADDANAYGWFSMQRSEMAWCAAPRDCTLQDLSVDPCSGQWICAASDCIGACSGTLP